jgi:hypothetical protein
VDSGDSVVALSPPASFGNSSLFNLIRISKNATFQWGLNLKERIIGVRLQDKKIVCTSDDVEIRFDPIGAATGSLTAHQY